MTTETGAAGARLMVIERCGQCKHYSTGDGQPACMKAEKRLDPDAHIVGLIRAKIKERMDMRMGNAEEDGYLEASCLPLMQLIEAIEGNGV